MTWGAVASAAITVGGNFLASRSGGKAAQPIPGQTQAGEYTPQQGGFGTYNYIPTGATQIDPQLIQMILGSAGANANANNAASPYNYGLMSQGMNNPYTNSMMDAMRNSGNLATQMGTGVRDQMPAVWAGGMNAAGQAGNLISQMQGYNPALWGGAQQNVTNASNLLGQAQHNPYAANYIQNAGIIGSGMQDAGQTLGSTATDYLGGVQSQVGSLLANPYLAQAQQGANTAGGMLTNAGGMYQNAGQNAYGQGSTLANYAQGGLPAASSVLNTAMDPQGALYNRSLQQTQDQIGAFLARSGLTDSGAGGKIASDALNNFNIDWQNQQLGRQTQGLGAYNTAVSSAGNNMQGAAGLQSGGANAAAQGAATYAQGAALPAQTYQQLGSTNLSNLNAVGNAAQMYGNLQGTGANLQMSGNAAGNNAYNSNLANILGYSQNYGNSINSLGQMSGQIGANTGNAISGYGNAVGQLGNINSQQANTAGQISSLYNYGATAPYNAQQGIYANQNSALMSFLNNQSTMSGLTNQNIGQGQNYLSSVMQGSSNASNAAYGAQGQTTTQNANAAAGMSGTINSGLNFLGTAGNAFMNYQPSYSQFSPGSSTMQGINSYNTAGMNNINAWYNPGIGGSNYPSIPRY